MNKDALSVRSSDLFSLFPNNQQTPNKMLKELNEALAADPENPFLQGHVQALESSPLSEAMQDAWNDHVNDTGCFPDCVEISNGDTITGTFSGSRFADTVEKLLGAAGYTISRENA